MHKSICDSLIISNKQSMSCRGFVVCIRPGNISCKVGPNSKRTMLDMGIGTGLSLIESSEFHLYVSNLTAMSTPCKGMK